MKNYKFSVITSFFNRKDWVETQYNLLKSQTYKNWEWIVTDDFSEEDKSAKLDLFRICDKDSRVKYFFQDYKKQVFYNPAVACDGDIILQTDCDDLFATNLLEHYNYWFNKKPEVYLIHAGYKEVLNMSYDGDGVISKNMAFNRKKQFETTKWEAMTFGRAWRNVIPHFEHEGMKHFQNDTNIIRHLENVGKVFMVPRVMYKYNIQPNSISNQASDDTIKDSIEKERIKIENKFPNLDKKSECTFDLEYMEPSFINYCRGLYNLDLHNMFVNPNPVGFIDSKAFTAYNQKIKEIYWDWDIRFNNLDPNINYESIVWNIHTEEINNNPDSIFKIRDKIYSQYPKTRLIVTCISTETNAEELGRMLCNRKFGVKKFEYFTMNDGEGNGDGWIKIWIPGE